MLTCNKKLGDQYSKSHWFTAWCHLYNLKMHSTKEYVQINTSSLVQWLFIIRSKEKKRKFEWKRLNKSEWPDTDVCEWCTTSMTNSTSGCPDGAVVKNLPTNEGSIPGLGRSPEVGNGNQLQCSFAWKSPWTKKPGGVAVHGIVESKHDWATEYNSISASGTHTHTHTHWKGIWNCLSPF